jgi:hypothetical protein
VNIIAANEQIHCDFIGLQENTKTEDDKIICDKKYQVGK